MMQDTFSDLKLAQQMVERGEYDVALDISNAHLARDPDSVPALLMSYWCHDKAQRFGEAYQFAARALELAPKMGAAWLNYGKAAMSLYRPEAEKALQQAVMLAKEKNAALDALTNLSAYYCDAGDYDKCEQIATHALDINPESPKAKANLGLAQLAKRNWADGWNNYGSVIGGPLRKLMKYHPDQPESMWDGTPDKRVVIYGEQGLGDEISFASMIPDAIKVSRKVIIDCDKRLEGLFKRSFPEAQVYGTRWSHLTKEGAEWDEFDKRPQASIISGHLGSIFRLKDSDFPGTPYLVADPERVAMWQGYFQTKRKPIIGIAWSGGLPWTADRFRRWQLEALQPIFNAVDAHWVCLQYKQDCVKEMTEFKGAYLNDYPYATRTKDYDDTAALVKSCDLVIGMQTSVMHLAAALGVETWCFVNSRKQWRYGTDEMLWYKAMKLFRQADTGTWPIQDAARLLTLRYGSLELKRA